MNKIALVVNLLVITALLIVISVILSNISQDIARGVDVIDNLEALYED